LGDGQTISFDINTGRLAGWQACRLAGLQAGGMGVNHVLCQIALNVQDICFFNQYQ
jgi:hypothetical protein